MHYETLRGTTSGTKRHYEVVRGTTSGTTSHYQVLRHACQVSRVCRESLDLMNHLPVSGLAGILRVVLRGTTSHCELLWKV